MPSKHLPIVPGGLSLKEWTMASGPWDDIVASRATNGFSDEDWLRLAVAALDQATRLGADTFWEIAQRIYDEREEVAE